MRADKRWDIGRPGTDPMPRIVALQGGPSQAIQAAMGRFADRWADRGVRIAGLVEVSDAAAAAHKSGAKLVSLATGTAFRLFQDLGPMASGCHLDSAGVMDACAAVCDDVRRGCDLVVLNKFGKLEACRSGLTDAFSLAVEHEIPILTAVSPAYQAAWERYAAPLALCLPPEDLVLDGWWRAVQNGCAGRNGTSAASTPRPMMLDA